jgi:alkylhydroperoxidase family enzyme
MSELMRYEQSARFTAREKIALRYADAIMYDPNQADDALWAQLKSEFSEPEIVEIGYWIGFTFGGQRWLKTLAAKQGEFEASVQARRNGRHDAAPPADQRIT